MKLINERTQIREVSERWTEQYGSSSEANKTIIKKALELIDKETATAKDLKEIIGNDSWTQVERCNECGARALEVVRVGEEPDYESNTAYLCKPCIEKALALFSN
jgi:hypothetical protein